MNEFVLEEKHKYWDNKRTLEEYIKDIEESGYIDCSSDYEYEYWYILENLKKLNNLQSKIDKAIEYVNKHCVNEKISKEVGYKCYTIADTNELEKIIKILGDDK